jgi:hypothetical protein
MPFAQLLADLILLLHFSIVLFIVAALPLIVVGNLRGWTWVNGRGFRYLHLAAIAVVVLQSWLGVLCPLTTLESWLREQAGGEGYSSSFIETWVQGLLYYQAPAWAFSVAYTGFGLLVLGSWWYFPPRSRLRGVP